MAARKKPMRKAKRMSTTKRRPVAKRTVKASKAVGKAKKPTRKAPAKKAASSAVRTGAISVGRKPFTKSELITTLAEHTGIARKEISLVLETVSDVIAAHLRKPGPEMFTWPGLLKVKVVKKPATKARQGVNPFTGEPMLYKAKPASRRVKVLPLKQLKNMVV